MGIFWRGGNTYTGTSKRRQLASPYPKPLHFSSDLQNAEQAAHVFFVPVESKK